MQGFDPTFAATQNDKFHAGNPEFRELPAIHAELLDEIRTLDPRRDRGRMAELAEEVCRLESRMERLHIYFERRAAL